MVFSFPEVNCAWLFRRFTWTLTFTVDISPSCPPERVHVTGTMASGLFVYAAWAAIGDDGSSTHRASGRIFAAIAAMKAGRPLPRQIRKMPAWITPAVWVPGGRQGAGSASPARRAGSV